MPAQLIKVTPSKAQGGKIDWTLCHTAPGAGEVCGNSNNYPVVVLGKGSGEHLFTVTINDPAKLGIAFSSDPLWIQANTKPTKPVIDANQVIDVTPSPTKLIFKDKNTGTPVDLVYQLNFVGPNQKPVTAIDPEIKNGGTTVVGYDQTSLVLGGVALVFLLAAIWLSIRAIRQRRQLNSGGGA